MAQYTLTTREQNLILNSSRIYADLPIDLSWVPTESIEDTKLMMDYELKRIEGPAGSQFGEHAWGVNTSRSETERQLISFRYKFSFNKTELRIAKRNNYALVTENLNVGMQTMNKKLAQLLIQGSTAATGRVAVNGMIDAGEDVAATLEAVAWNTATEPVAHIRAGVDDLIANNYAPPYTMLLSWSLWTGLQGLNAAGGQSHAAIGKGLGIERYVFAANGKDAANVIYPMPYTAKDGNWIMCAVSPENFYIAEASAGVEISPLTFEPDTNSYSTFMEWRGVPVFRGAAGTAGTAPYIVYEPDVILA